MSRTSSARSLAGRALAGRALVGWALGGCALAGCNPGVEDAFFVHTDGADLPVWLQGDRNADTFVLVQHGAGSSGKLYDWMPAFDALEQRYAFVYWDQRGAGMSQGDAAGARLTLDESVHDLGLVLAAVRDRYHPPRLVMLGHSLGGGLSLAFLRDPARADGIAGYVDVCGGRNLPEAYDVTAATVRADALQFSQDDKRPRAERDSWSDAVAFYDAHPDFPRQEPDRSTHAQYVTMDLAERGFDLPASTSAMESFLEQRGVEDTAFGTFDALAYGSNTAGFEARFDFDGVALSPEDVSTIPVPALVLAGRFDFAVPVAVPQATFDAFAADKPPSRMVVLEHASHFAMWDEPDGFVAAVTEFIDALR